MYNLYGLRFYFECCLISFVDLWVLVFRVLRVG